MYGSYRRFYKTPWPAIWHLNLAVKDQPGAFGRVIRLIEFGDLSEARKIKFRNSMLAVERDTRQYRVLLGLKLI